MSRLWVVIGRFHLFCWLLIFKVDEYKEHYCSMTNLGKGPGPLWVIKEEITDRRKASRASKTKPPPSRLARGALWYRPLTKLISIYFFLFLLLFFLLLFNIIILLFSVVGYLKVFFMVKSLTSVSCLWVFHLLLQSFPVTVPIWGPMALSQHSIQIHLSVFI